MTDKAKENPFLCGFCRNYAESYMLYLAVWRRVVPNYKELKKSFRFVIVCLACVEYRLRRPLTLTDFTNAPINDAIRFGYRLAERL